MAGWRGRRGDRSSRQPPGTSYQVSTSLGCPRSSLVPGRPLRPPPTGFHSLGIFTPRSTGRTLPSAAGRTGGHAVPLSRNPLYNSSQRGGIPPASQTRTERQPLPFSGVVGWFLESRLCFHKSWGPSGTANSRTQEPVAPSLRTAQLWPGVLLAVSQLSKSGEARWLSKPRSVGGSPYGSSPATSPTHPEPHPTLPSS